jgi:hypothetical protein
MGGRGGGGEQQAQPVYVPPEPVGRAVSLKESQRDKDQQRKQAGAITANLGRNTILASILGDSTANRQTLLGG